jgi:ABC-type sugar transport system ATPase subunit
MVPTILQMINRAREERNVALVGVNGAGKSTLLNTISGIIQPGRGKILLEGNPLTKKGELS